MQPSAELPTPSLSFCLPPGFHVLVEVDAQNNLRILIGRTPMVPDASLVVAMPPEVPRAPNLPLNSDSEGNREKLAASGLDAAKLVAEARGEDALLKYSEWDALLPRSIVRRKIKRALKERRLLFTTKDTGRDGRAKMISAREMVRFLAEAADER